MLAGFTSVTSSWYVPVAGTSTVTVLVIGVGATLGPLPWWPLPCPSLSPNVGGVGAGVGDTAADLEVGFVESLVEFL